MLAAVDAYDRTHGQHGDASADAEAEVGEEVARGRAVAMMIRLLAADWEAERETPTEEHT